MAYVLREARVQDVESLQSLLAQPRKGIIHLPNDRSSTIQQFLLSEASFIKSVQSPDGELYIFVLEDLESGNIVGLSAIHSPNPDTAAPSRFFQRSHETHSLPRYAISSSLTIFSYVPTIDSTSEMCSLFLDAKMRGKGIGSLLSIGRFLYIANTLHRFTDTLTADFRGVITSEGESPFYEGLTRYFFQIPLLVALEIAQSDPDVLPTLIPTHPIYIDLLPTVVQKTIGVIHEETVNACTILTKIGFKPADAYDIFDGGPKFFAPTSDIKPIVDSREIIVDALASYSSAEPDHIFSAYVATARGSPSFRATKGYIALVPGRSDAVHIDVNVGRALSVQSGDTIRVWRP